MKKFIIANAIASLILFFVSLSFADEETLELFTGNVAGTYYSVGKDICQALKCEVETSNGSIENIDILAEEEGQKLAIVQSDVLHNAYFGLGVFKGYNFKQIAMLGTLYEEAYTIVVRANSKIYSFRDLKNKTVNVGKVNSGNYHAVKELLELYNMKALTFKNVSYLPLDLQGEALCKGTIDVAVYAVGHPDKSLSKTAALCNIRILTIDNEAIQNLVKTKPHFIYTTIKAKTYPGNDQDIKTLGVMATLVAPLRLPNDYVYNLVSIINDPKYKLKLLRPSLRDINLDTMIPLHPGAQEFYSQTIKHKY